MDFLAQVEANPVQLLDIRPKGLVIARKPSEIRCPNRFFVIRGELRVFLGTKNGRNYSFDGIFRNSFGTQALNGEVGRILFLARKALADSNPRHERVVHNKQLQR
jgi:hypothetical protein